MKTRKTKMGERNKNEKRLKNEDKIKLDRETAIAVLKEIIDPELHIDIWTLGLIYDIDIDNKNINIKMTFTSPMCPYGPVLLENINNKLKEKGFLEPHVEIVFTPMWQPSKEVMMMLGLA